MKKLLLLAPILLAFTMTRAQNSFYQIPLNSLNGKQVNLAGLTGKKIFVAICSAAAPDLRELLLLDSLYKSDSNNIRVILIPVTDFDASSGGATLNNLVNESLRLPFVVAAPGFGSEAKAGAQMLIMKWLTHASLNGHFNYDIGSLNQVYVISERGVLFGILFGSGDLLKNIKTLLTARAPGS